MCTQPGMGAWDKCSGLVHWEDPEGSGREGGGRGDRGIHVNPWLIHVNVWQNPLQYCKVISLQLIKINEKKKLRICLQCRRPRFDPGVGKIPWRREWLSTAVFLPGELHGQGSLASYSTWSHKESDMTEWLILLLKKWYLREDLKKRSFTEKVIFKRRLKEEKVTLEVDIRLDARDMSRMKWVRSVTGNEIRKGNGVGAVSLQ